LKNLFPILLVFFSTFVEANIDFRNPIRNYINIKESWNIFYEEDMQKTDPELTKNSLIKLQDILKKVEKNLPKHSIKKLKRLKIFLLWGEKSPKGGLKSGMRYVRQGETITRLHYDARWENSVVIYSAENLMYLTEMWAKKAIAHELAHAWHIMHWPEKHRAIVTPWKHAKEKNLYRNVRDYKNRIKPEAYALKNNLEYFAELSAMYFVGGDYFPYERRKLTKYDPEGVKMVKELWNVR